MISCHLTKIANNDQVFSDPCQPVLKVQLGGDGQCRKFASVHRQAHQTVKPQALDKPTSGCLGHLALP